MRQPTTEDVLRFMKEYFRYFKRGLVFDYTFHVSLCGSLDTFDLVAYDKDHDIYHLVRVPYPDLEAAPIKGFGPTFGPRLNELHDVIAEYESHFLKAH